MVSERRIAANRANAQKSTGPKSAEGKARARRDALKHGMTSRGDVLPLEDEVLFKERLAGWTNDARPVGDIENYLVASAVLATVRLHRCVHNEFAVIARKLRRAIDRWESKEQDKLGERLEHWADEPAEVVPSLLEFTAGCDWMIDT